MLSYSPSAYFQQPNWKDAVESVHVFPGPNQEPSRVFLHVRIRGLLKAHGPVSQVRLHFEPLTPDCILTTPDRLRMWEDTWKEWNFLSFLNRNSVLFCIVVVPVYIPTSSVKEFPFLHTLSSIYRLQTFWWRPFWLVWGDTSMQFWFAFLW